MSFRPFLTIKSVFGAAVDGVKKLKKERVKRNKSEKRIPAQIVDSATDLDSVRVELCPLSVAKGTAAVLLVLALAYFLLQISEVLLLFFVSFLLTAGLDQSVTNLKKRLKIPRALSVVLLYILLFGFFAVTLSSLAPLVAEQVSALAGKIFEFFSSVAEGRSELPFADKLAPYFEQFTTGVDFDTVSAQISAYLTDFSTQLLSFGENIWSAVISISNGLLNVSLVLVLTFFMIVEWESIEYFFISLFPSKHTKYVVSHIDAVKSKIGYWLRGQLMLSLAMGVLTYIALLILGLDYALTLALIAALSEFVPVVGPIIAFLFALPVAANVSLWMLLWVTIAYLIIQQIEGNVLVPLIMKKAVGLSPIIVIFAMLVGFSYLGILGVMLSVPVAASLAIFVRDYTSRVKKS